MRAIKVSSYQARLRGAVLLATAAALLGFPPALAQDNGPMENVFTGCVGPGGMVRNLQRGDEPKRKCPPRSTEVRFAEVPRGLSIVSWDVELQMGEDFSPAPGIEIRCFGDPDFGSELSITISGESMGEMFTMDIGREYQFAFMAPEGGTLVTTLPFIVRAAGLAFTLQPEFDRPCGSAGYAELFDWPPSQD
jgi:hypothetical protein